jgi:hypothetical protein
MALEKSGPRLFVNMTTANVIGVVDREKRTLVTTWPITAGLQNVPMHYDESTHRYICGHAYAFQVGGREY